MPRSSAQFFLLCIEPISMDPVLHQAAAAFLNPQPPSAGSDNLFPQPSSFDGGFTSLLSRLPLELSSQARLRTGRSPWHFWRTVNATLKGHALLVSPADGSKKRSSDKDLTRAFDVMFACEVPTRSGPQLHISGSGDQYVLLQFSQQDHEAWMERLRQVTTEAPVLSDFTVEQAIGKGGGGQVFLVRPREESKKKFRLASSSQYYAMKVIPKYKVFHSDASLQHTLDERLGLQLAASHPFIVTLRHAFQTEKSLYLLTDFCRGGDLRGLLNRRSKSRLAEEQAVRIFAQIVLAIEHLHSLNIVYRDLKPDNVLLTADGDVRLCDLGLAKILSTGRWGRTKSFCGTVSYMSPEVVRQRPYGISTDLWSLGVLLYRCLVGKMPFDHVHGSSSLARNANDADTLRRIIQDDVSFPSEKTGILSPAALELLRGLLEKDDAKRFNLEEVKESAFFSGVDWDLVLERGTAARDASDMSVVSSSDSSSVSSVELANFDLARVRDLEVSESEMKPQPAVKPPTPHGVCNKKARVKGTVKHLTRSHTFLRRRPSSTSVIGYAYTGGYEPDVSSTTS